jgi:hypothetical protein
MGLLLLGGAARAADPARPQAPATLPDPSVDVPDPQAALFEKPPPGTVAEDAKLWQAARDVALEVRLVRLAATRAQRNAGLAQVAKRLDAAAAASPEATATRLQAVRRHLSEEYEENFGLLNGRWPVDPTRVCRYPHQRFDAALKLPRGQGRGIELDLARERLEDCIQRARLAVGRLGASNRELNAAIAQAEAALREVGAPAGARGGEGEAAEPAGHEDREAKERAASEAREQPGHDDHEARQERRGER